MATEEIEASKLKKGDLIQDPGTGVWIMVARLELGPLGLQIHYDDRQGLLLRGCRVQADRMMVRRKRTRKGKARK